VKESTETALAIIGFIVWLVAIIWALYTVGKWFLFEVDIPIDVKLGIFILFLMLFIPLPRKGE